MWKVGMEARTFSEITLERSGPWKVVEEAARVTHVMCERQRGSCRCVSACGALFRKLLLSHSLLIVTLSTSPLGPVYSRLVLPCLPPH